MEFKPGDKCKIVYLPDGNVGKYYSDLSVSVGDTIIIGLIHKDMHYNVNEEKRFGSLIQFKHKDSWISIALSWVELISDQCTCDFWLGFAGCTCGYFQREQEKIHETTPKPI